MTLMGAYQAMTSHAAGCIHTSTTVNDILCDILLFYEAIQNSYAG